MLISIPFEAGEPLLLSDKLLVKVSLRVEKRPYYVYALVDPGDDAVIYMRWDQDSCK